MRKLAILLLAAWAFLPAAVLRTEFTLLPGVKSASMGQSWAVARGADSLSQNPAGLAGSGFEAGMAYATWQELSLWNAFATAPVGAFQLGAEIRGQSYGDLTASGIKAGTTAGDFGSRIGGALRFGKADSLHLDAGAGVDLSSSQFADAKISGLALNFGLILGIGTLDGRHSFSLGGAVRQIGFDLFQAASSFTLPVDWRGGCAWRWAPARIFEMELRADLSGSGADLKDLAASGGMEAGFWRRVFLRAGVEGKATGAGFSFGAGVHLPVAGQEVRVSYSLVPLEGLGIQHGVGVSMGFGTSSVRPSSAAAPAPAPLRETPRAVLVAPVDTAPPATRTPASVGTNATAAAPVESTERLTPSSGKEPVPAKETPAIEAPSASAPAAEATTAEGTGTQAVPPLKE